MNVTKIFVTSSGQ